MKKYPFLTLSLIIIVGVALYVFLNKNWTGYYYHAGENGQMTCEVKKFSTEEKCSAWPNRQEVVNANEFFFCGYRCEEINEDDPCSHRCKDDPTPQ